MFFLFSIISVAELLIYSHKKNKEQMQLNSFTLIDAFNQFWKACQLQNRRTLNSAGLTYFYLCSVWNGTGRPASFCRQNNLICAELDISKPALNRHRNALKRNGLIDFISKGKGDPNISYTILALWDLPEVVTKEHNVTTSVTSFVTTHDAYKQSKSKEEELFVVIEGEVTKYYFLKNLYESDVGLQINFAQKGMPAENFSDAVLQWIIQNNGNSYHDFEKARKHFLFWMPNYQFLNEPKNGQKPTHSNRKTVARPAKTDMDYAAGL
jgi:hypothetical protein